MSLNARHRFCVQYPMKTNWVKRVRLGLCAAVVLGVGATLVGCADEYAVYPGYRGGYYTGYYGAAPYYGGYYGYAPYRRYGPYYGSPYSVAPYYRTGGVVSSSRSYRNSHYRSDRRRSRTAHSRRVTRRASKKTATRTPQYQSDDESKYYSRH